MRGILPLTVEISPAFEVFLTVGIQAGRLEDWKTERSFASNLPSFQPSILPISLT